MLIAETGPTDTTRYQMLETLRQHAEERLDLAGDADAFRRRHANYYARASRKRPGLRVPDPTAGVARGADAERDNLRAAVYWPSTETTAIMATRCASHHPLWPGSRCGTLPAMAWARAEQAFDVRSIVRPRNGPPSLVLPPTRRAISDSTTSC
jgi:predicted ATPase